MLEWGLVDKAWTHLSNWMGVESRAMYLYKMDANTSKTGACGWAARPDANGCIPQWSLLRPEEIPLLAPVSESNLEHAALLLKRGDRCYVSRLDGQLAHHTWVQTTGLHPITEAGVELRVESGEFWIYHAHTAEWARGLRLYPTAIAKILCDHFRDGFQTAWVYTQDFNTISQRGIERNHFERVAILRALRCGRFYQPMRDGRFHLPARG